MSIEIESESAISNSHEDENFSIKYLFRTFHYPKNLGIPAINGAQKLTKSKIKTEQLFEFVLIQHPKPEEQYSEKKVNFSERNKNKLHKTIVY